MNDLYLTTVITICLFFLGIPITADTKNGKIDNLIRDSIEDNLNQIQELGSIREERAKLYGRFYKTETNIAAASILNVLPAFGVGSFLLDDTKAGFILLTNSIVSYSLIRFETDHFVKTHESGILGAGIGLLLIGVTFGLFWPQVFAYSYNLELRQALDYQGHNYPRRKDIHTSHRQKETCFSLRLPTYSF